MDDAARVRRRQRIGHRNRDSQHFAEAQAVARDERVEALAPHVLHHDELGAVGRLDLVDGDDVGMVEGRGGLRFLDEAAAAIRVRQAVGGEHLDGDLAVQPRVAGAIDLAHAAGAEQVENLVGAEPRAGCEPHARGLTAHHAQGLTSPTRRPMNPPEGQTLREDDEGTGSRRLLPIERQGVASAADPTTSPRRKDGACSRRGTRREASAAVRPGSCSSPTLGTV